MDKNKTILLIQPPIATNSVEEQVLPVKNYVQKNRMILPPNDLMLLGAIAEDCGYISIVKDYRLGGDLLTDIKEIKPDIVVGNITIEAFKSDMKLIESAKQILPNLCVILKGLPFMTYNINAIYENPFINYVLLNEVEFAFKEILDNHPNEDILGICYSDNMQGVKTELRQPKETLDELPFPARHLIDNTLYKSLKTKKPQAVINLSKGCNMIDFLSLEHFINGTKLRLHSIDYIISDIKTCVEKYKIKDFLFWSDNYMLDEIFVLELSNSIIRENLKINWMINSKFNINDNVLKTIKKAGCNMIDLNLKSGSQLVLDKLVENIDLKQIKDVIKNIKKYKISITNSFIIGLPWDTEDTIKETFEFSKLLEKKFVKFQLAMPLPCSKFFTYALMNKLLEPTMSYEKALYYPMLKTHKLSKDALFKNFKKYVV